MTNLLDDTETTGRRLFEPIALALLAAGGMSASVARSDGGNEQPGLIVPPLTAQAHAAGSPAPDAGNLTASPAAMPTPTEGTGSNESAALAPALSIAADKPALAKAGPNPNRFAEVFPEAGAVPASLALERPEPNIGIVVTPSAEAGRAATAEQTAPVGAAKLVTETSAPSLQLVATQPVPAALPISAAPAATNDPAPSALVAIAAPAADPAPSTAAPIAPTEPVRLAVAPALEAVTKLDSQASAPVLELPAAQPAPTATAPAALVEPTAATIATPGPSAPAITVASAELPKPAFVSEPLVQALPASAAAKPLAPAVVQPAIAAPAAKAGPTARLAKPKTPRLTPIGGTIASNFELTDGTIDYRIGARVNGGEPSSLALRITRDDQLSVKLGDLLALVKPGMDPALYAYLAASHSADEYVSFAAIRSSGIDIRYDAARDQLLLGVE